MSDVYQGPSHSAARSKLSRPVKATIGSLAALSLLTTGTTGYLLGTRTSNNNDTVASSPQTSLATEGFTQPLKVSEPMIATTDVLKQIAAWEAPVYWAGERPGENIEVTMSPNGGIFVRYLPEGVPAGDPGSYLTIATYDITDSYESLSAVTEDQGDLSFADDGAAIVTFKDQPNSTYFAFLDLLFQVEVYSPEQGVAKYLVESGKIGVVGYEPSLQAVNENAQ